MIWLGVLSSAALAVLALALWVALRVERRVREGALARAAAAEARLSAVIRLLGLGAQELRDLGLRLHGQAGHAGGDAALAVALRAASAQLLDIGDEFESSVAPPDGTRSLREERVELAGLLAEAQEAAASLLAPGQRNWRMPESEPVWLWADRRALRHVLGRVLADAVRNTGDDDWIEIALCFPPDEVAVVVEDEGIGLAVPDRGAPSAAADSRGIGLRLAVARSLMEAHGGRLEIEARPKVGTRISLAFPSERLRPALEGDRASLPSAGP